MSRTSLYAILARVNPVAVIFRRGPSRQVKLIKWHLRSDSFEHGQWFKGRDYERRCDLSPSGERLAYFAASFKKPFYSWTAVSRPPFFTAICLWPKGDCWGGGALFDTERRLLLNHRPKEMAADETHSPPKDLKVVPYGYRPGWGEDFPIWRSRMERDGWAFQEGTHIESSSSKNPIWITIEPPDVFRKFHPRYPKHDHCLQLLIEGLHEREGAWYLISHRLMTDGALHLDLGRTEWADWDSNGDLLFAQGGKLFRLSPTGKRDLNYERSQARMIADFTDERFEAVPPPPEAMRW